MGSVRVRVQLGEDLDPGSAGGFDGPDVVAGLKTVEASPENRPEKCRTIAEIQALLVEPVPVIREDGLSRSRHGRRILHQNIIFPNRDFSPDVVSTGIHEVGPFELLLLKIEEL